MSKVYLLHAYSPRNSGDGLLVKLSLQFVEKSVSSDKYVVCLDPIAFKPYLNGYDCKVVGLLEFFFLLLSDFFLRRKVTFFGVGGGYMRASNFKEGAKTFLAHGSQLFISTFLFPKSKKFYLPQSIGPLNGAWGKALKHLFTKVDIVYCRDDKTISELGGAKNARRVPDLVVIEILKEFKTIDSTDSKNVGMIMRDLPDHKKGETYVQRMQSLFELLSPASLVVQSEGRGNDDILFYQKYFPNQQLNAKEVFLAQGNPLIVSVRLHGSLESILSGSPSVHIAYERKGHAAYSDLGISDYCFHVSDFDPAVVSSACEKLSRDSSVFWNKVREKAETFDNPLKEVSIALGYQNAAK